MQLVLLLSVAAATTTVRNEASSPVEKVVKLLTDMKDTLSKEAKTDQEAYEKLSCWCETNDKGKTEAIEVYERLVEELESEIEQRTKKAGSLADDITKTTAEIAQIKDSIEAGEAQRAKDGEKNHAEEVELTSNIESLKGAIIVLKKHQATAFPQLHLDFLSMGSKSLRKPDDLDKLSSWMGSEGFAPLDQAHSQDISKAVGGYLKARPGHTLGQYSSEEISELAKAKKLVKAFGFTQQSYVAGYANQSGEIFGILTQLKEQLEADLKDVQEKEGRQATNSAALLANLKEQLAATEQHLKDKEHQQAKNSKALSDAKESLEDTKTNLDSDSKFLVELKALCAKSDEEWEARSATRANEIAAVSEALGMLTADDARDLFSTTYSFVQVDQQSKSVNKAAQVLRSAGLKYNDKSLLALSESVQLDGFVKVKKAINDMVGALKQQQDDEVKHKDFCTAELHDNAMETSAKEDAKADLETTLDGLESTIETLTTEVAAATAAVADLEVQQQRASMDRAKESKVFQQTIEDQRATQDILAKVLSRLNEFYTLAQTRKAFAFVQQTPQEEAYKAKNVVPPVKFGEYKKSGGSGGVLTMIGNLITDAKNLEKEAINDENDAQAAYESFVKSTNGSRKGKEQEIVDKTELRATAEMEKEQAHADHEATIGDLEELAKYAADVHSACDFVLKNFDIRQAGRGEEIEALQSALAILSGMQ